MEKRSSMRGSRGLFTGGPSRLVGESCRESHASLSFATTDDDMDFSRSVSMERSARRSMARSAIPRLSPYHAAAMLSLPWPPPETKKDDGNGEEGSDEDLMESKVATGVVPKKAEKKKSKASNVTLQQTTIENLEREYQPFAIPKFQEVHTNWPGFEHEPISNWMQKYMFAKPYRKDADLREDYRSKGVISKPSFTNNNNPKVEYSDEEREEDANVKIPKSKSTKGMKKGKGSKPRRRLYVESVGNSKR